MTFPVVSVLDPNAETTSLGANPDPQDVIKILGTKLTGQLPMLNMIDNYYRARQPINFIHPEVRRRLGDRLTTLIINFPRLVADTLTDRLDVNGFRLGQEDGDADLWRIWQANRMDVSSIRLHGHGIRYGRGFTSVWAGRDKATPKICVESPRKVTVDWDPDTYAVRSALKMWQDGKVRYATVYLLDRIEKFQYDSAADKGWVHRTDTPAEVDNPLGVVPIVPYLNRWDDDAPDGESELTDIFPIADAINKLATDMMVTSEFHAMPRRWATDLEVGDGDTADRVREQVATYWKDATAGEVWLGGKGVKFGQFTAAELTNFVNAFKALTVILASLAALPGHYVGIATDNPASADAIRAGDALLDKRAERIDRTFGESHEDTMRLAVMVRDGKDAQPLDDMETMWADVSTPTPAQLADAAVKKVQAEIIDVQQAQEDLGYSPQQIERMGARREAAIDAQADEATQDRVRQAIALIDEQGIPAQVALASVGLLTLSRGAKPGESSPPPPAGDPITSTTT